MLDGIRRRMKVQSEHPLLTMSVKLILVLFAIPIGGLLGFVRYRHQKQVIEEEVRLETDSVYYESVKLEAIEPATM